MLDAVEGELMNLSVSASDPSGELRITAPSVLSRSTFMDTVSGFSKKYSRIRLTLNFSDSRQELIEGGFDLGIRMGPDGKSSATSRILFRASRKLVASVEYLSTRDPASDPSQL